MSHTKFTMLRLIKIKNMNVSKMKDAKEKETYKKIKWLCCRVILGLVKGIVCLFAMIMVISLMLFFTSILLY